MTMAADRQDVVIKCQNLRFEVLVVGHTHKQEVSSKKVRSYYGLAVSKGGQRNSQGIQMT